MEVNRILQGDCLGLMKMMPDDSVDLTITSPPYNVGTNNMTEAKYGAKEKDSMTPLQYAEWLNKVVEECVRVTKNYVFFNIQMLSANRLPIIDLLHNQQKYFKEVFVWNKSQVAPAIEPGVVNSKFEFVFVFSKHNPQKRKFDHSFFPQGSVNNVIDGRNASQNEYADEHKATFPLYLPGFFIKNFSVKDEIIFDPFMGTGTTAFAAREAGRQYFGIDIDPEYCKLAEERLGGVTVSMF